MKKIVSIFFLAMGLFWVFQPSLKVSADSDNLSDKVDICHKNQGVKGWTSNNVNASSVDTIGNGNNDHNRDDHQGGQDIIPPFYDDDRPGYWSSRNWDVDGQAIWNNGCKEPGEEEPTPTPTPTPEKKNFNLTSMCKINESTGQMRVRNNYLQPEPFKLFKYGGGFSISGTAGIGDTLYEVPWTSSSDTFILEIGGYRYTKAIGNNAICEVEPTPTPTEEPTPTPTEVPEEGKTSVLGYDMSCEGEFAVTFDLKDNGVAVENVFVSFTYNGLVKEASTNVDGRARVTFPRQGNYEVKATPNDGYESRTVMVNMPDYCEDGPTPTPTEKPGVGGLVLGASTEGQVLGASTMAPTGIAEDMMALSSIASGIVLLSHAQSKKKSK